MDPMVLRSVRAMISEFVPYMGERRQLLRRKHPSAAVQ